METGSLTMERYFWQHVEARMKEEGLSEQQVLDTIKTPGWTGRRARIRREAVYHATPALDRKMAAAGPAAA
jgi:hypothetical protein